MYVLAGMSNAGKAAEVLEISAGNLVASGAQSSLFSLPSSAWKLGNHEFPWQG